MTPKKSSPRVLAWRGRGPVLLCGKCLQRMEHGGKVKRRLKASLRETGGGQKKDRPRLVLTNCFGICQKNAAVAGSAATFARGELVLIEDWSKDSIEEATAALV